MAPIDSSSSFICSYTKYVDLISELDIVHNLYLQVALDNPFIKCELCFVFY